MPKPGKPKARTFAGTAGKIANLAGHVHPGLQALPAKDAKLIQAEDTRSIRASAFLDAAYAGTQPNANRWDYGIAIQHTNRQQEFVYWVETHTGDIGEFEKLLKKAQWLLEWFKADGKALSTFEKEIVWVSSGSTYLPLNDPKRKRMNALGLRAAGGKLQVKASRP